MQEVPHGVGWLWSIFGLLKDDMKRLLTAAILVGISLSERLWFDLGPNVELVTITSLIAAVYLGRSYSVAVPLVSLAISDYYLGNTKIFIFTWSAFIMIGLGAVILRQFKSSSFRLSFAGGLYAALGSLFFFFWTNFGVWLLTTMYPKTFTGLMQSYYMGLPFLRWSVVSNLIIAPVGFLSFGVALVGLNWLSRVVASREFGLRELFS